MEFDARLRETLARAHIKSKYYVTCSVWIVKRFTVEQRRHQADILHQLEDHDKALKTNRKYASAWKHLCKYHLHAWNYSTARRRI